MTSTRLLVTSWYTHQLRQFDADEYNFGDELRRVQLPDHMQIYHAMESPAGRFIISLHNSQLKHGQVVEVNTAGEVLRQFGGSRPPSFGRAEHVAVDSHGNVFVADEYSGQILLLDDHLSLRRVIIDEHQLNDNNYPKRLCYMEQSGHLLVGSQRLMCFVVR